MPAFKSCFRLAVVEKVDSVMQSNQKSYFPHALFEKVKVASVFSAVKMSYTT
jgi:hypothetical protein